MKKWGKYFMKVVFSIIAFFLLIYVLSQLPKWIKQLFKWLKEKRNKQSIPKFTTADRELLELISDLAEIRRSAGL